MVSQTQGRKNGIVDQLLLVGILATTFFLPTLFGSISIAFALLLALFAGTVGAARSVRNAEFVWQPTLLALLGSFAILFGLFALNARSAADLGHLVSFLGLALPLLLYQFLITLKKPVTFARIAKYCVLGLLIGLLFAFVQKFGLGIHRTVAVAAGSNAVARAAVILGFLAIACVRWRLLSRGNMGVIALGAAILIVLLSGSRGALLTVPIATLIAIAFVTPVVWEKSKPLFAGIIALLVAACAVLIMLDPSGMVSRTGYTLSEMFSGRLPGLSSELRFELLVGAWKAFLQAPVTGYGWAGHWDALMSVTNDPEYFAPVRHYFTFHNDIADFAVAGGVIGLFAYAMIILAPIANLILDPDLRANRRAAYALVLLPVCYFFFGLTDFVFGFDLLTTLYGFSLAFILAAAKGERV